VTFLLIALFLAVIARLVVVSSRFVTATGLSPITLARLAFDTGSPLRKTDGRTNVLLLGIAGGGHPGAQLTDTMLILSIRQEDRSLGMISIPRDIWSDTLKDRVNSAYFYGEQKKEGGGVILTKAIIEDITGLTMHYGLLVDFSGFQEMIDLVGGVDVAVPKAFTDTEFPIVGKEEDVCDGDPTYACRYEALHFDEGVQHMDGETALKYVRTRHAEGAEGTDFARGRRQQEVLLALRSKLMDPNILFSPTKIRALMDALDKTTQSDMTIGELLTVGKLIGQAGEQKTKRISIEDLLYDPPSSWFGRYVLLPKENFEAVHEYIVGELR
jgi:LCP family protein required for cell wall assembly